MMIQKRGIFVVAVLAMFLFTACGGSSGSGSGKSSDKSVTFFGFSANLNPALTEDAEAVLTGGTIIVTVPVETDVTGLIASFTAEGGVTVDGAIQESGVTPNDFTSPVTYTVTAEDGTMASYIVTVLFEGNISAFSFTAGANTSLSEDAAGTIEGTDITVIIPYDVSKDGLIADFEHNGTSVSVGDTVQASGTTANDFSSPVVYTVTGTGGDTVDFTVTVKFNRKIYAQEFDLYPFTFCTYNDKLYFLANNSESGNSELWVFDGENDPSEVAGDFENPEEGLIVYNDKLYFQANDTANAYGAELWSYDGTTAEMAYNIYPESKDSGSNSSWPAEFAVYNGKLYFQAKNETSGGYELFVYDSDTGTASLVENLNGSYSSDPSYLTVFNDKLYFRADSPYPITKTSAPSYDGIELWVYDGVTVYQACDITENLGSSSPEYLTVYNDYLYFSAEIEGGTTGNELWRIGTDEIPEQVEDINTGADSSNPQCFYVYDGRLYFRAYDGTADNLWVHDSDAYTTEKVTDSNSEPIIITNRGTDLAVYNGRLFFRGYKNSADGASLWAYDGTDFEEIEAYAYDGSPELPYVFGNMLCLSVQDENSPNNDALGIYRE